MKIDKVIPALDDLNSNELAEILPELEKDFSIVKVGLELFLRDGKKLVEDIHNKHQLEIFLDLKLHDIPNTVSKAIASLEGLSLKFLTIHTSGGKEMMRAAKAAQEKYLPHTTILGVTLLTSLNEKDNHEIFCRTSTQKSVEDLMKLGLDAGINSFVCSANDLEKITIPKSELIFITPGIRFKDDKVGDQSRVLDPKEAFHLGATYIVMGRSLLVKGEIPERIRKLRQALS